MGNKTHWENVFATKTEQEVSWYQSLPATSIHFIQKCAPPKDGNVIDVGGGDSHFVDYLIENGYKNIYVLDISANAIERAKKRLGEKAKQVNWIVSDVTEFKPDVKFDFWHDRAAFHFLTSEEEIGKYISITEDALKPGGSMVIGTFSVDGPKKCSGLEIKQYSPESMPTHFSASFENLGCTTIDHKTPFDTLQNFIFCTFSRK